MWRLHSQCCGSSMFYSSTDSNIFYISDNTDSEIAIFVDLMTLQSTLNVIRHLISGNNYYYLHYLFRVTFKW